MSDRVLGGSAPAGGPFRFEDPHDLLETHLARTSRSAHWIYGVVVLLVVGGLSSLPLVTVDVYVSAPGVIRVSLDADLIGDVFVPPGDIGFIRPGGPVLLRVHAFNAREWGVLTGRVESIGGDVVDAGAGPVFRVRASIDRSFLELPDGHRGHLRKGMTFEARFLVARRSLYQLLRDRVHDWILSPATAG